MQALSRLMSMRPDWVGIVLLLTLAGALRWSLYEGPDAPLAVALLLPADVDEHTPLVEAWQAAAQAEGLSLALVSDDAFLRPTLRKPVRYAGLILPASLHPAVSAVLRDRLQGYVEQGGKLMVVYDAASLPPPGHLAAVRQSPRCGGDGSLVGGLHQSGKGRLAFIDLERERLGMQTGPAPLRRLLGWFGTDGCGPSQVCLCSEDLVERSALAASALFGHLKSLKIHDLNQGSSWK